jgi:hypothetical protein
MARYQGVDPQFKYEVVPDSHISNGEAQAISAEHLVKATSSFDRRLREGDKRADMILIEEIVHVFMKHPGARNRSNGPGPDVYARNSSLYNRAERQARSLAARIKAPIQAVTLATTPEELASRFVMSLTAAKIRFDEVQRTVRRSTKTLRKIPAQVLPKLYQLFTEVGTKSKYIDFDRRPPVLDRESSDAVCQGFLTDPCSECGNRTLVHGSGCVTCHTCGSSDCN